MLFALVRYYYKNNNHRTIHFYTLFRYETFAALHRKTCRHDHLHFYPRCSLFPGTLNLGAISFALQKPWKCKNTRSGIELSGSGYNVCLRLNGIVVEPFPILRIHRSRRTKGMRKNGGGRVKVDIMIFRMKYIYIFFSYFLSFNIYDLIKRN